MIGQTLAHYRVTAKLGAGGMGEVYRATDERLGREVAIKVLPEAVAGDPVRLARFQREAHLLAALNDPGIAAIHGLEEHEGRKFLVLELVEGQDLKTLIERAPLPLDRAIGIALQICRALEAAHDKNIVHRDVKPSNVRVSDGGQVKVLDLGLAKALTAAHDARDTSSEETETVHETREGTVLGSPCYMSPEQARGDAPDRQTDIWAWACVFYEMLTGRRAFPGQTRADALAAVLERDPDWAALPTNTPPAARSLLRRCLQKERDNRLREIADARLELEELLNRSSGEELAQPGGGGGRAVSWPLAIALVSATALVAVALSSFTGGDGPIRPAAVSRFVVRPPDGFRIPDWDSLAVSSDGALMAFVAREPDGQRQIFVRALAEFESRPLPGTAGGLAPFFSPSADRLGFYGADGTIHTVAVGGGPVTALVQAGSPPLRAILWTEDGLVFPSGNILGGLAHLDLDAGRRETLTTPDLDNGELSHGLPAPLPGGQRLLFSVWSDEGWSTAVLSLASRERRTVIPGGWAATYVPDGLIVYLDSGGLMAAPFDAAAASPTGPARRVIDDVASYAISDDGTLLYRPVTPGPTQLTWIDRSGRQELVLDDRGSFHQPTLSPDGRHLAAASRTRDDMFTFVLDLERGSRWRPAREGSVNNSPLWSPDGSGLAFNSARRAPGIYKVLADGSDGEELLLRREDEPMLPRAWSPDGETIAFDRVTRDDRRDIWLLPLAGRGSAHPLVATPADEHSPVFSPDGRWLVYVSDETGRSEVYARRFPGPGEQRTISASGGSEPRFSSDGRELFYLEGKRLMVVRITLGERLGAGKPRVLIDLPDLVPSQFFSYDVAPDGQRFVMVRRAHGAEAPSEVRVVMGFVDELRATLKRR